MNEDAKYEYRQRKIEEIQANLDSLFSSYDTKLLATMMFLRSTAALRGLHTSGVWKIEDVQAIVQGAMASIYLPLDNMPEVRNL